MSRPTSRGRVGDFDENSPRPPVPGEETEPGFCSSNSGPSSFPYPPIYRYTPRSSKIHSTVNFEGNAPLGFEPEGSCSGNYGSCSPFYEGTRSPPPCLQWAKNLSCLLQDTEGVELFRSNSTFVSKIGNPSEVPAPHCDLLTNMTNEKAKNKNSIWNAFKIANIMLTAQKRYLEREGKAHADALNFWFACEGLKKQPNKDLVTQLVKAIYKKFIISPELAIRDDLRREVTARIRENLFDKGVFDSVQADVGKRITATTYPNFLKSDIYLNYVRQIPQDYSSSSGSGSGSGSSSSSAGREASMCGGPSALPTVHEDSELVVNTDPLPLTRDTLVATQSRRALELRPKPEAYAGVYLQHGSQLNTRVYSSYNPVSRQDSELQSLSSDARTDSDAMSCTDSSVDGASVGQHKMSKRHFQRQFKAMKENASLNRDVTYYLIPRTQRINPVSVKSQRLPQYGTRQALFHIEFPMKPEEFAKILIQKLEMVKREMEAGEKLERKLKEAECEPEKHCKLLEDVIREKFPFEDQDCDNQAILDQHVSRVWSDLTPNRSPGLASPRPKSPDGKRKMILGIPHPYQTRPAYSSRHLKKEKDVFSNFSSDSGNIHDFADVSESGRHFPKSKSVPDYVEAQNLLLGYDSRGRSASNRRSGSSKKGAELFDSGVSVQSGTVPVVHPNPGKDTERVKLWLEESSWHSQHSDSTCSKRRTGKQSSTTSSGACRHGKKSERSGSLERCPQQPFVADPSMPPLPRPHTATQLEEARRRLIEDDSRGKLARQRFPNSSKTSGAPLPPDVSISNQSTLRKSLRRSEPPPPQKPAQNDQEYTTVMFSFCEEQFPYRTKLPGRQVTLKQFKDILPKKGVYRYYFKTMCAEVDAKVINQEVVDDNEELPLWEGKLIAQVKPVE